MKKKRQHKIKLSAVLLTLEKKRIFPGGSSEANSQALVWVWMCVWVRVHAHPPHHTHSRNTDTKAGLEDKNSREGVSCFPAPFSANTESSLCANERKQL